MMKLIRRRRRRRRRGSNLKNGFLMKKPAVMSATSVPILVTSTVGKLNEFRVPITLFGTKSGKIITTTTIIDSGAGGSFINWMFVRKHWLTTQKLSKPFHIRTVDGSNSKDGHVTDYCVLTVQIDNRCMIGKFNVTQLSEKDDMLLGVPWLKATAPEINWTNGTIAMARTKRSHFIERVINRGRTKAGNPAYDFTPHRSPTIEEEEDTEEFTPQKKLPRNSPLILKQDAKKKKKKTKKSTPAIPETPDNPPDQIPTSIPEFDATNDTWVGEVACALCVDDIATYPIADDEVLLEYSADGTSVRLIENFDFA